MLMLSDLPDRPALEDNEIEITPEMIRAGMHEMSVWDPNDSRLGTITSIYSAMERVRRERV